MERPPFQGRRQPGIIGEGSVDGRSGIQGGAPLIAATAGRARNHSGWRCFDSGLSSRPHAQTNIAPKGKNFALSANGKSPSPSHMMGRWKSRHEMNSPTDPRGVNNPWPHSNLLKPRELLRYVLKFYNMSRFHHFSLSQSRTLYYDHDCSDSDLTFLLASHFSGACPVSPDP